MDEPKKYWFPAKQFGWGWGIPITWQGWVVFSGFLVLSIAGVFIFPPHRETPGFVVYTTLLVLALIGICYAKGEPPASRWGKK